MDTEEDVWMAAPGEFWAGRFDERAPGLGGIRDRQNRVQSGAEDLRLHGFLNRRPVPQAHVEQCPQNFLQELRVNVLLQVPGLESGRNQMGTEWNRS